MTKKNCSNKIKCDVESCKHQNNEKGICNLEEIQVSCDCNNDDCECCEETICQSFECSDDENDE